MKRYQHIVLVNRRLIIIGISRNIGGDFKEFISTAVHIRPGSRGQSNQISVKIVEDGFVLFENAAMAFIDDD